MTASRSRKRWRDSSPSGESSRAEAQKLDAAIETNLKALGFEARMENGK